MDQAQRKEFLFDLCMALRKVPPGSLREMGKRRLSGDELAERADRGRGNPRASNPVRLAARAATGGRSRPGAVIGL
jgi:hypothetical protein